MKGAVGRRQQPTRYGQGLVAGATRSAATARGGTAGAGAGTGIFTGNIFLIAAFKIGFIPATTFKTESGRGNFLFQFRFITGRTDHQRVGTKFLQSFVLMTAGIALIFINGHSDSKKTETGL
jgi:hypothetical protein